MLITLSEAEVSEYITKGINLPGKVVTSVTLTKGRKEGSKTTATIVVEDAPVGLSIPVHTAMVAEMLAMPVDTQEFVPEVIAVAELPTTETVEEVIPEVAEEAEPPIEDEPLAEAEEEAPVDAPAPTSLFTKALAEAE